MLSCAGELISKKLTNKKHTICLIVKWKCLWTCSSVLWETYRQDHERNYCSSPFEAESYWPNSLEIFQLVNGANDSCMQFLKKEMSFNSEFDFSVKKSNCTLSCAVLLSAWMCWDNSEKKVHFNIFPKQLAFNKAKIHVRFLPTVNPTF